MVKAPRSTPSFPERYDQGAAGASQIDDGATQRIALPIGILVHLIQVVDEVLAREKPPMSIARSRLVDPGFEIFGERIRHASLRSAREALPIIGGDRSERKTSPRWIAFSSMAPNTGQGRRTRR